MSEQQRAAIVTGAAGGIGRELVLGLLGRGLRVAAVDRSAQGLAEFARRGKTRAGLKVDAANPTGFAAFFI